ncbi:hypothetical protein [Desulfocurvus vexinensis]|uniref:hypothetical protein n=1 Tax=Desulfocurvus vexinensis TaxID=399548 RepID=UPI00048B48DA|nr:hypothetical protein [Desulfocurvus vexinensis]
MATYELDITFTHRKTVSLSLPDDIPPEDVQEWAEDSLWELFRIDPGDAVLWDNVDDLVEGAIVAAEIQCLDEDDEYELEGWERL